MAPIVESSHLTNVLASPAHLETTASQLDGVPKDLEDSVRFETARLVQVAGLLLRLPQELIAQAITVLYRFWAGADGGSMLDHDAKDVAAAVLYLTAKPSAHTVIPRQVLVVFAYLISLGTDYWTAAKTEARSDRGWHISDGQYETSRATLYKIEAQILRTLGFETRVALPYTLCVNYMQALDLFTTPLGPAVAKGTIAHLNTALLSPQLLCLTHQPSAIATAAIYLAAREIGAKLPEVEWWEVFDVDREELGFLVVALRSVEGFALEEQRQWGRRMVPLTVEGLRSEVERRKMLEDGE